MKKQFLLNPFSTPSLLKNKIFESPYGELRDQLAKRSVRLDTYDIGDLAAADKVLHFNFDRNFIELCQSLYVPKNKMVLFAFEPKVVIPQQHNPQVWRQFDKVFTFNDGQVDNKTIFKLRYPQEQKISDMLPAYDERKLLVLINANKFSYIPNELYSLRRRAIRYFERNADFSLYGYGWHDRFRALSLANIAASITNRVPWKFAADVVSGLRSYKSYRGSVEDKYETMANFKYALCFENEKETPGYITEKIFDCFFAGTVPIYFGAPNITQYIPKEAFIDLRDFRDLRTLLVYLEGLNETDWNRYFEAGQRYIRSEEFHWWRSRSVFTDIANDLLKGEK